MLPLADSEIFIPRPIADVRAHALRLGCGIIRSIGDDAVLFSPGRFAIVGKPTFTLYRSEDGTYVAFMAASASELRPILTQLQVPAAPPTSAATLPPAADPASLLPADDDDDQSVYARLLELHDAGTISLTKRQYEVLDLTVRQHKTQSEIAELLTITVAAVKKHKRGAKKKLPKE